MSIIDDINASGLPAATRFVRLRASRKADPYNPAQTTEDWKHPVELEVHGALASSTSTRTPDVLDVQTTSTAVLTVAHVLGLDIDAAAKALSSFEGVRRRFTHVGDIDGITVVDDYGHHPTEIKATLAAASSLGYKHVDVVFQPHRYSRLQALCDDFADAFANADKLLLIDVFSAGEMPIPGVTSKMLADTVRAKHPGKEVVYCSSRLELNQELEQMVGEGDLLLTMGAGDVTTVGPEFIEYLTAKKDA